jgi:two-component system nitrate/nitrite response regulator NarL
VFLADDHPLFLEAVTGVVRARPDLELVGAAGSGPDAVSGIRELEPDVALLDMRLRGLNGQEVLDITLAEGTCTRFLFLSAYLQSELVYAALARGASGYLSKEIDGETICDALVAVAAGQIVLSPDVQRELAGAIRHRDGNDRPALTARERTVLALAADGLSTPQIARRLGVATATVKTHLQSIYHKLDAPDRTSAVAVAMRRGMLE